MHGKTIRSVAITPRREDVCSGNVAVEFGLISSVDGRASDAYVSIAGCKVARAYPSEGGITLAMKARFRCALTQLEMKKPPEAQIEFNVGILKQVALLPPYPKWVQRGSVRGVEKREQLDRREMRRGAKKDGTAAIGGRK